VLVRRFFDNGCYRICSFNCLGLQSSTHELFVLSTAYDIMCLQEIWLLNTELCLLNNILPGFHGFGLIVLQVLFGVALLAV